MTVKKNNGVFGSAVSVLLLAVAWALGIFLGAALMLLVCVGSADAASYKYCQSSSACTGVVFEITSLQCPDLGFVAAKWSNDLENLNGATNLYSYQSCTGAFTGTVGESRTLTFQRITKTTYAVATVTNTYYLEGVTGDMGDEVPVSQLLVSAIVCLGFGLGVVAGQQR